MDWRFVVLSLTLVSMASARYRYRKPEPHYPKDTEFWATDFFVHGCRNFLDSCPSAYKKQFVCGINYSNDYKNFANYCEMQYENCNTWRNWRIYKREPC